MHTVEPATINYTSSGETSAATRNNAPSSPPFPADFIRNAPSLLCGFHPQSPLVPSLRLPSAKPPSSRPFPADFIRNAPSLPCGFHPQSPPRPVPSLRISSAMPRPVPAASILKAPLVPSLRLPSSKSPRPVPSLRISSAQSSPASCPSTVSPPYSRATVPLCSSNIPRNTV